MEGEKFPYDVIIDVLSRLSVKDLMRFKCVSKQWNYLISDPLFMNLHTQRSTHKFLLYITCIQEESRRETHLRFTATDKQGKVLQVFTKEDGISEYANIHNVFNCNNLICFSLSSFNLNDPNECKERIYICNPVTQELVKLPTNPERDVMHLYGFGYLSSTKEYKVLRRVLINRRFNWEIFSFSSSSPGKLLGTDSRSSTWRLIKGNCNTNLLGSTTFVNESIYWLGCHSYIVTSLDLQEEKFRNLPPVPRSHFENLHPTLADIGGNLSCYNALTCHMSKPLLKVWTFKDDYEECAWTPAFNIDLMPLFDSDQFRRSHLIKEFNNLGGEELLILIKSKEGLYSYNYYNIKKQTLSRGHVVPKTGKLCFYKDII